MSLKENKKTDKEFVKELKNKYGSEISSELLERIIYLEIPKLTQKERSIIGDQLRK